MSPGPRPGVVRAEDGALLSVPASWTLVPPGDAALTRRIKKALFTWSVQTKRARKVFSEGIYADAVAVASIRADLEVERADPRYAKKLASGRARRERQEVAYAEDFETAVYAFLRFAPPHDALARALATAISAHATPVGSGTVARTERIPLERRAEAATIAWLRHATTGYDEMAIPRVKGMRREVRRMLAERSRALLGRYRRGEAIATETCLLRRGLSAGATAAPAE